MNEVDRQIEAALCALLRGEPVTWPKPITAAFAARLHDIVLYHGVGPLVSRRLALDPSLAGDIPDFCPSARQSKDDAAIELARKHQLVRALGALLEVRVAPLLLKGAGLAYSLYPFPALRPRVDTDLLIRSDDQEITDRVLTRLGYEKPNAVSGELVTYQRGYVLKDRSGIEHVLDVHWRISNTQLFSRALTYDELSMRAVRIAELGEHARGLSAGDALLHACMHRVHHLHSPIHVDGVPGMLGDRLIWLYDIHLLIGSMSAPELLAFAQLAVGKGMRSICRDGLLRTCRCFGTKIDQEVLAALAHSAPDELSAAHLRAGAIRRIVTELRSLSRWRDRVGLLREHLFPSMDYMRGKYSDSPHAWLPMLYLRRGLHGAWKKLQSP